MIERGGGLPEQEEEEEEDEEMDGGTDYANNYFDNGEEFEDEDNDNLDEGGIYWKGYVGYILSVPTVIIDEVSSSRSSWEAGCCFQWWSEGLKVSEKCGCNSGVLVMNIFLLFFVYLHCSFFQNVQIGGSIKRGKNKNGSRAETWGRRWDQVKKKKIGQFFSGHHRQKSVNTVGTL